jgi:hypothetical protein
MATLYDADGNAIEVPDEALGGAQGPEGLRKHAKQLEKDLKAKETLIAEQAEKVARYERKEAFEAAVATAGDVGVTLEELGELPAEQITPALLKAKAAEKEQAKKALLAEQAKSLGFETVEQYEAALKVVAEKEAEERKALAAAAAVAAGGGSGAPPVAPEGTVGQKGVEAWQAARKAGKPQDKAQTDFVHAVVQETLAQRSAAPAGA